MNVIDNFCNYIKQYLPKLTNYFGENIKTVQYVDFINKEIYIKFNNPVNLMTGQKVFLNNFEYPIKITNLENNIFTTSITHNYLAKETKEVYLQNLKILKTKDEITETIIYSGTIPLIFDVDYLNLQLDLLSLEEQGYIYNYDITDTYLIRKHSQIINGLREVEVIDDTTIKLINYTLNVNDYRLSNNSYVVSIGQRVFGCFDLEDAINSYCNSYGLNDLSNEDECFNKLNLKFKDNDNLTCFVSLDTTITNEHNSLSSEGRLGYTLNIFIFQPIKGKNKYLNRDMIEYYTFGVFNKILGNKNIRFNDYLTQQETNSLAFDGCNQAIERNNVLYVCKISYKFNIMTSENDFVIPSDYWRLNNLYYETDNKSFNIFY